MAYTITRSDTQPVTVKDAKLTARIDDDSEDRLIQRLIAAATRSCEAYIGLTLMASTYSDSVTGTMETISLDLPDQYLSYTATFTQGGSDVSQSDSGVTIQVTDSTIDISFNAETTVNIDVLAGISDDPTLIDPDIKMGIELLVEYYYSNRSQSTGGLPQVVKALWFPHKEVLA